MRSMALAGAGAVVMMLLGKYPYLLAVAFDGIGQYPKRIHHTAAGAGGVACLSMDVGAVVQVDCPAFGG